MTTYSPGEIVLVRFPFSDLEKNKQRPAMVFFHVRHSKRIDILSVAMITSKVEGYRLEGDILLKDWEAASLLHPSLLRLSKMASIDTSLVMKKIGKLTELDRASVRKKFLELVSDWL